MPMNPQRLRIAFAIGMVLMLALVIGFYSYARYRVRRALVEVPAKLGVNIQQSTEGFTFSKSEGGRTLFSLTAGKAVQYKQGQRATLSDVRIVVYGRNDAKTSTPTQRPADHYDQILGSEFDYDPASGDVTANGEVQIDLDAEGKPAATIIQSQNQAQPVGTMHLRTSALTFNQKTGIAQTEQRVDFALPQASGSALGAKYDSKLMALILQKEVRLNSKPATSSSGSRTQAATITADSAVIADQPRRALLTSARGEQRNHKFSADTVTFSLRPDGTISDLQASGNVRSVSTGKATTELRASAAEFTFGANNEVSHLELNGQVALHQTGGSEMAGSAGHATVSFGSRNQLQKVRATNDVHFSQGADSEPNSSQSSLQGQALKLAADAVELYFAAGNKLQRAETSGNAQLETDSLASGTPGAGTSNATSNPNQAKKPTHTTITAGKFDARFGPQNRMKSLFASPQAKIVSSTPGQPDNVSTSQDLNATFDPKHRGALVSLVQRGDFRFNDSQRTAAADSAEYTPADDTLSLSGSPQIQDIAGGLNITADHIKMNRVSQGLIAEGNVKTTYDTGKRKNSGGALLSSPSGEPAHVTADAMTYSKNSGLARFTGHARLWQGADIIEAAVIALDQKNNSLVASANNAASANVSGRKVTVSFAKTDKGGKIQPVTVTGSRLTYTDADRQAKWDGPVEMKMADATMSAKRLEVFLQPKSTSGATANAPSQIDHAIAHGDVVIEQKTPPRKATGDSLTYTAAEDKFVLTGTSGKPPSIFDAEHGNVTGNSLTFYNRDDRVQISGGDSSRTVIRTTVKSESKP